MSKSKSLTVIQEILELNSGLFVNPLSFPLIDKLDSSFIESIFSIISRPDNWNNLSSKDKIIYMSRGSNGYILRQRFLT